MPRNERILRMLLLRVQKQMTETNDNTPASGTASRTGERGDTDEASRTTEFALQFASAFINGPILSKLAKSGHSSVYCAMSGLFGRPVAVKVINVNALDGSIASKFLPRELYFTQIVHHPHIGRVHFSSQLSKRKRRNFTKNTSFQS
ncbi:unnamed protein product [Anisakis simplex]|uniref:Protein kinase domain-containing protein n=1 Tax=Anisakis simplex TaxID=6269 RepID=A0A0M3J2Q0_ANISI|nr:unnamed protein product [Anisakis simplex]